jgi:hypothetical protein
MPARTQCLWVSIHIWCRFCDGRIHELKRRRNDSQACRMLCSQRFRKSIVGENSDAEPRGSGVASPCARAIRGVGEIRCKCPRNEYDMGSSTATPTSQFSKFQQGSTPLVPNQVLGDPQAFAVTAEQEVNVGETSGTAFVTQNREPRARVAEKRLPTCAADRH